MKMRLKKDLVIKAGTLFVTAPTKTELYGSGHIEAAFGLSKNTCGVVRYSLDLDEGGDDLSKWFEPVKERRRARS
jgi:hypothetical protein